MKNKDKFTNDIPFGELVREAYAQFGLAYYLSDCIHKGLSIVFTISDFEKFSHVTRARLEEKLSEAYNLTLGQLKKVVEDTLPSPLFLKIEKCVQIRNHLAHKFWYERIHLMFSEKGVKKVISELKIFCDFFSNLNDEILVYNIPKLKKLGVSEELVQSAYEETVSGEPFKPLLEQRKPKQKERLIRVWEFELPDGSKPLIFETDDGCLWQLCDVGLGWTYYDEVGDDWTENEIINQYLPATMNPRPKNIKPWNYEFKLGNKAIIWVKPGRNIDTHKWEIRKQKT